MAVLVEVHDREEQRGHEIETPLIGINNRNLKTFDVTRRTLEAMGDHHQGRILVTESGSRLAADVIEYAATGVQSIFGRRGRLSCGQTTSTTLRGVQCCEVKCRSAIRDASIRLCLTVGGASPADWPVAPGWETVTSSFKPLRPVAAGLLQHRLTSNAVIFPPAATALALQLTPPDEARVVILGRDHLPRSLWPSWLAFSVSPGTPRCHRFVIIFSRAPTRSGCSSAGTAAGRRSGAGLSVGAAAQHLFDR
jgi:hypothetical protein